ncbi:MAG TPA: beta-agarase, partial [Rhodanobacter sp.]|nr:beta-agarase [Rhodanobacter sp.]
MKRIVLAGCLALLCGCHAQASMTPIDLAAPAATAPITLERVHRDGAPQTIDGFTLQRYAFEASASPALTVTANALDAGDELQVQLQNAMPWAVTLTIDIGGANPDQHLHAQVGLPAGPPQTLVIPLHATSPRQMGMQVAPPMPFDDHGRPILLATSVEGRLESHTMRTLRLGVPAPQAEQTLLFGRVEVVSGQALQRAAYTGIVDRYGQAARGQWPEKITSDAALRAAHASERAALDQAKMRAGQDEYGGRLDVQNFTTTGWFHTQKVDARWYLVTPAGHAFFSLGVNAVAADGGRSYVEGREFMFTGLPPRDGEWAAFYGTGDNRSAEQGASQGIGYNHG